MRGRWIAAAAAPMVMLALAPTAGAATLTVTTTADERDVVADGTCSLREAVQSADNFADFGGCVNTGGLYGGVTIILEPGATYVRTLLDGAGDEDSNLTGDLDLFVQDVDFVLASGATGGAVIEGNGTVAGGRVIEIGNGLLDFSDLTIRSGNAGTERGGGIQTTGGAELNLRNVTVADNAAGDFGGGLATDGPTTLTNVTLSGNSAGRDGGAWFSFGAGDRTLSNVTVTGNTADSDADGLGNGGGLENDGGTGVLGLRNTIVAGNTDASPLAGSKVPDCDNNVTSLGHNLIGSTTGCNFTAAAGDRTNNPAGLGPLAANGGPTQTHALLSGSDAIDAGDPALPGSGPNACESTDQRGLTRSLVLPCDIGAYELVLCGGVAVNRFGTAGPDTLKGTRKADGILGLAGNDLLKGLAGNDSICGGKGRDRLIGGKGRDRLLGQAGRDLLRGGKGRDRLRGGPGRDTQIQ